MVVRVHKYADGGKIVAPAKPAKQPEQRLKHGVMKGNAYQIDKQKSTAEAMKQTRKKQMEDLGL